MWNNVRIPGDNFQLSSGNDACINTINDVDSWNKKKNKLLFINIIIRILQYHLFFSYPIFEIFYFHLSIRYESYMIHVNQPYTIIYIYKFNSLITFDNKQLKLKSIRDILSQNSIHYLFVFL